MAPSMKPVPSVCGRVASEMGAALPRLQGLDHPVGELPRTEYAPGPARESVGEPVVTADRDDFDIAQQVAHRPGDRVGVRDV